MQDIQTLCQQFAQILGGKPTLKRNACMVEKDRPHVKATIMGRPTSLSSMWSFESLDAQGNALNLGEAAVLQEEVYPFTWHLQRSGIVLSALHNHWIMENPPIFYVHYISIEDPLSFAKKAAEAYKVLR